MPAHDFLVSREDLRRTRFAPANDAEPGPGQVLLKVDRFAFTANNVTYAVAGDMMSYWSFFPAEPGWGRVPVWGFGDVLHSRAEGLAEGARVFGYYPMSTHLTVQPEHVTRSGFIDASSHRASLPAVYNQYTLVAGDPGYRRETEAQQMLFRPLFMTAFVLDDFLADNEFFGARQVILSSASSKTSLSLAYLLHTNRRGSCEVIGLTSRGNADFVRNLGCYDKVMLYDAIDSLSPAVPTAFVDMAGDAAVTTKIHHHFRDNQKHTSLVGLTHWQGGGRVTDLPGATPSFFFAPTQIQKRHGDWGPGGLEKRYAAVWAPFLDFAAKSIKVVEHRGTDAVERAYRSALEGEARPDQGVILSLWN